MCSASIADTNNLKFLPPSCNKKYFNTYKYPYTTFHPYLQPGEITNISTSVPCTSRQGGVVNIQKNMSVDESMVGSTTPYREGLDRSDTIEGFMTPQQMRDNRGRIERYEPTKKSNTTSSNNTSSNNTISCGVDKNGNNACGMEGLFPVLDPRFNMRESAKQLILLEDHLSHEKKRCRDCILKHVLTIEGFLEEGVTLDKDGNYRDELNRSLIQFRSAIEELMSQIDNGEKPSDAEYMRLAQKLRQIRKPLCQTYGSFKY